MIDDTSNNEFNINMEDFIGDDFDKLGEKVKEKRKVEGDTREEAASRVNELEKLDRKITGSDVRDAEEGSLEHQDILRILHYDVYAA